MKCGDGGAREQSMKVMSSLKNEEGGKGSERRLLGMVERSWDLSLECLNPGSVAYQLCDFPQITHLSELYFSRVLKWGHYDHHHFIDLTALLGGLEKRTCMKCFGEAARQTAVLLITP